MNKKEFEERLKGVDLHPIVPMGEGERAVRLDFTEANHELQPEILNNTELFTNYINEKLSAAGAVYGFGGYNEHRPIYSRSEVFDESGEEPRRLHLGMDVWGKPHTKVMSPLDGVVHSFDFHKELGNYGAVVILSHSVNDFHFHTLYGHLSLNSLKNLEEGQSIRKGDAFAEFGLPFENGHWPPHLHFQIILDMQGRKGDYLGVCKYSEREKWLEGCPDPAVFFRF